MSNASKKLYDYQLEAKKATDNNTKGIICMPTGTGKTFVQAAIISDDIRKNRNRYGVYVINAPRIMLSYQLLKEVYSYLNSEGIDARYMSVHSGGKNDIKDLEKIRQEINVTNKFNITYAEVENGTSPRLIKEFSDKAKEGRIPLVLFSTYNSASRIAEGIPDEIINIVVNDEAQYLVQDNFHDIIRILNTKKCFFFTATTIHTPSDKGRGMNNEDSYGKIIYMMSPREAINRGKMVRPRLHYITSSNKEYTKEEYDGSLNSLIVESFNQHGYILGKYVKPKLLVTVKGVGDIQKMLNSKEYKKLLKIGVKIYAVASDEKIGNDINGTKVSRREFLKRLKEDGRNPKQEMIILHYDILAEGIDVPGITGIMPLRNLGKSKFLQTFGRAARLESEDRINIERNIIKPDELDKLNKPFSWIIIPSVLYDHDDGREHVKTLVNELRDYGFNPYEDIISLESTNGLPEIEDLKGLNDLKKNNKRLATFIEDMEAEYEDELVASLSKQEQIRYILLDEFPELIEKL